jgi:hypothetical protein
MLIEPDERLRIDPFIIKDLEWWQEPYELPSPDIL